MYMIHCPTSPPPPTHTHSLSICQIESVWVGSEGLSENARMVALLEEMEINSLLVLEVDPLRLGMRVE